MSRLILGIGIKDDICPNSSSTREYILWKNMLNRCYGKSKYATYKDCTVSDYFLLYSNFYKWCNLQVGFGNQDFELDKDLLILGNKLYDVELCVFLPTVINTVLNKCTASRGNLPIGVTLSHSKFQSQIRIRGDRIHLGVYSTPEEAFQRYKFVKEKYIKELAEEYKDRIDTRAYVSLLNYTVDITD